MGRRWLIFSCDASLVQFARRLSAGRYKFINMRAKLGNPHVVPAAPPMPFKLHRPFLILDRPPPWTFIGSLARASGLTESRRSYLQPSHFMLPKAGLEADARHFS